MKNENEREDARTRAFDRIFGKARPKNEAVDHEEEERRKLIRADFELVFMRHPRGKAVLAEIARILHFMEAARTSEEQALQNAFKTILHHLGRWNDDRKGADDLVERLLKE